MIPIGLSEDGESITIHKFHGDLKINNKTLTNLNTKVISYLDVETTGLNANTEAVTEIGILQFEYCLNNDCIVKIIEKYQSFQDPKKPIPAMITELTGITDDMVKDQEIDKDAVNSILQSSDLILSHNATFDRAFIDPIFKASQNAVWGCSVRQIDWRKAGFSSKSLGHLCRDHGFFFESHRALCDVLASVHLLTMKSQLTAKTYLNELFHTSHESVSLIQAFGAAFETKDELKAKHFRWNAPMRVWEIQVTESDVESIIEWMNKDIYKGKCKAQVQKVPLENRFKA
jgi:DNA polymerase-3 subunit epsilon